MIQISEKLLQAINNAIKEYNYYFNGYLFIISFLISPKIIKTIILRPDEELEGQTFTSGVEEINFLIEKAKDKVILELTMEYDEKEKELWSLIDYERI